MRMLFGMAVLLLFGALLAGPASAELAYTVYALNCTMGKGRKSVV